MPRLFYSALLGGLLAFSLFAALLFVATEAHATTPTPRAPSGLPATIEPFTPYVEQAACDPIVRPGTAKLARLLAATYRTYGGTPGASPYAFGTDRNRSEPSDRPPSDSRGSS